MKTNKLAAGALALALGLGAIAPSYAATKDEVNKAVGTLTETQKDKITRLNAELEELKAAVPALEANVAAARAKVAAKEAELKKAEGSQPKIAEYNNLISEAYTRKALAQAEKKGSQDGQDSVDKKKDADTVDAIEAQIQDWIAERAPLIEKRDAAVKEAKENLIQARKELSNTVLQLHAKQTAINTKVDDIKKAIKEISDNLKPEELNKLLALVNNDVVKVVEVPATPQAPAKNKAEVLARAEKAYTEARETVKAVEILKEAAPAVYKNHKAPIDAYLTKANAVISKLGKLLGKNVAVSDILFSKAYADEANLDEIENATKEAEEVTKEGKDLLKDVNKKEEAKPSTEDKKDPAKKASKNAKTGVVGVTGVAGILAAASVAYAASKKRD